MKNSINVTVWNEYIHEKEDENISKVYPEGIHNAIAGFLKEMPRCGQVSTATLEEPDHGLTEKVLDCTDVLLWWGHIGHEMVEDRIVNRIYNKVMAGMGLIVLHSGHASKIFMKLCETETDRLYFREDGKMERLWVIDDSHPITKGLGRYFEIPQTEMYGERFHIPQPDELIFISWHEGGEVFRSGCTFTRGKGKIFYFSPGHETFPIYYQPEVQKVIVNAVEWAYNDRS